MRDLPLRYKGAFLKILFLISHGLYLRNFGDVIRSLLERHHEVVVAFTAPRQGDESLVSEFQNIARAIPPKRQGWWWPTTEALRALRDHIHYMQPPFARSEAVRARIARRVPDGVRRVVDQLGRWHGTRNTMAWLVDMLLKAMPVDAALVEWIKQEKPDLVLGSTLVDMDNLQSDCLRAANAVRIPTADCVASWDNLTTKTRLHFIPDRILVWNESQEEEAARLHGVPRDRLFATGAQLYDDWFAMQPRRSREQFCNGVGGLDPAAPIILYAGSSPFICPEETSFFQEWLSELRSHPNNVLSDAGVLVRPHPLHDRQWRTIKESSDPRMAVWPFPAEMPISRKQKQDYFDSLWHADVVVGVNTSAFLEASILGKRTFTIEDGRYRSTQGGTLHFSRIRAGGLIVVSPHVKDHFERLEQELTFRRSTRERNVAPEVTKARGSSTPFVSGFLRPRGLDLPASRHMVEAIEALEASPSAAPSWPWWGAPLRWLLAPIASLYIRPKYLERVAMRENMADSERRLECSRST